jgi:CDP-diacylglycerol---glycerol-3-phosphate 3-phosphatidyltransferase
LRFIVLPIFFYLYNTGNVTLCLVLFGFTIAADLIDGDVARKLKATSKFGAYYDAATDFALIVGIYAFFATKGFYPIWLLQLIIASFVQFLATSRYAKKIYDPIGRYIGSELYIGEVLTLFFPTQTIITFIQYAFVAFS